MIKARAFLIQFISLICLIFLINGLLHPALSQSYIKKNFLYNKSLLSSSNSSTWSRIWEREPSIGEEIITDSSYNVYVIGRIYWPPEDLIFNIKYDEYGHEQWNTTWKFKNIAWGYNVAGLMVDTQQNIYNLINLYSLEDKSVLMKINNTGFSEWNQTFSGNADLIYIDKYDKVYVSGHIWDGTLDKGYIFLKKFDQNGISLWNNTFLVDDFHHISLGYPCAIMVDHLNQTFVAGVLHTYGFPGESTYFSFGNYNPAPFLYITVYNSSGNLISFHKWRIYDYYISKKMIFDISCNFYVMGVDKSLSFNKLFKYNSSGELIFSTPDWEKDAIEDPSEFWKYIALDPSNNTYCSGTNFWTGIRNSELYIVKNDNEGNFEWDGAYNFFHDTHGGDIYIDSNFSIYLTGNNDEKTLTLKNPNLGNFSEDIFHNIDIGIIISTTVIFCIGGLIGIFFYIRFSRRSSNKTLKFD